MNKEQSTAPETTMNLNHFALVVTDACNFDCSYCAQEKGPDMMGAETVKKALRFFFPFLMDESAYISFYGGEPLLAMDNIRLAAKLLEELNRDGKKKIHYTLTTNGSLLTGEMLDFFEANRFRLVLSFDGAVQDMSRRAGSMEQTEAMAARIKERKNIKFGTYSVFTPDTAARFRESMRCVLDTGTPDADLTFALTEPWDDPSLQTLEQELPRFVDDLLEFGRKTGTYPVRGFRPPPAPAGKPKPQIFSCAGGRVRMAVSPQETVWGCFVFHSHLRNKKGTEDYQSYSFGPLDEFIAQHETIYPKILENYLALRQDCYIAEDTEERHCFLCESRFSCSACPASGSHLTGLVGKFPGFVCRVNKAVKAATVDFQKKLNPPKEG